MTEQPDLEHGRKLLVALEKIAAEDNASSDEDYRYDLHRVASPYTGWRR